MIPANLLRPGFSTKSLVQNHEAASYTEIFPEVLRFARMTDFGAITGSKQRSSLKHRESSSHQSPALRIK